MLETGRVEGSKFEKIGQLNIGTYWDDDYFVIVYWTISHGHVEEGWEIDPCLFFT